MTKTILLVDCEPLIVQALERSFAFSAYTLIISRVAKEALRILRHETVDVVISSEQLSEMNGTEFLAVVAHKHPAVARVMLTGSPSIQVAADAVNYGQICGFLIKPWSDIELQTVLRQAFKYRQMRLDLADIAWQIKEKTVPGGQGFGRDYKIVVESSARERSPTIKFGCKSRFRL